MNRRRAPRQAPMSLFGGGLALLVLAGCAPDAEPAVRESPREAPDLLLPSGPAPAPVDLTGVWTVTDHALAPAATMSEEDAANWHGRTLRLVDWEAQSPGARCADPDYQMVSEPTGEFIRRFESWPPDLFLPAQSGRVDVMSVGCEGSPWTAPGGTMIGVDSGHALTVWDGVFFTLERDTEAEAVDFRGTGNEPGWIIEVTEGRQIHFLYDYGESEIYTPAPERSTDAGGGAIEYHAVTESADLRVRFEAEPCADDMSGFPFPATVRVTLDARTFRGCGGPAPGAG